MDPYTSRSMDMLLPLTESDRRRRGVDQDCSVSLRSYSDRPRSMVSFPDHKPIVRLKLTWYKEMMVLLKGVEGVWGGGGGRLWLELIMNNHD